MDGEGYACTCLQDYTGENCTGKSSIRIFRINYLLIILLWYLIIISATSHDRQEIGVTEVSYGQYHVAHVKAYHQSFQGCISILQEYPKSLHLCIYLLYAVTSVCWCLHTAFLCKNLLIMLLLSLLPIACYITTLQRYLQNIHSVLALTHIAFAYTLRLLSLS